MTKIDQDTEAAIRAFVAEHFPNDTVVGEEDDTVYGTSGFVWYIDPIDGTDNFVRKIPFFAITATRLGPSAEDSFSVIHNPISGQTFASLMEDGSYENEHLCNHTADTIGGRIFIDVSGNSKTYPWTMTARANLWKGIYQKFGKCSSYHCALLGLAYVAAGRLDGYLSLGHKPWDAAAGLYLVKSAGGAISVCTDGVWQRYTGAIKDLFGEQHDSSVITFASHPDIHDEILDFIGDPEKWADE